MGQEMVEAHKEGRTGHKAADDGDEVPAAHMGGHLGRGLQQAQEGRAQHHAAGGPQHGVHGQTGKFAAQEDGAGPQADRDPGKDAGKQGLQDGMTEKCFHETFSFWLVRPGPTYHALLQQRATGWRPQAVPSTPDRAWHPGPSV